MPEIRLQGRVESCSLWLNHAMPVQSAAQRIEMTKESSLQGFRVSPQQHRLWQLHWDQKPFLSVCRVRISGEISPPILDVALARVVEKYEILRTNYRILPGMRMPIQVISAQQVCLIDWIDLRGLPGEDQDAGVRQLWETECERHVNLEDGCLLHARCIQLQSSNSVLLLSVPCIATDRTGLENLVPEIEDEYLAARQGNSVTRSDEGPPQYADIAETLNECLEKREVLPELMRRNEASAESHVFISHAQGGSHHAFQPASVGVNIPPALQSLVCDALPELKCGWEEFVLTCWQVLISRRNDFREDTLLGVFCDGRNHEALLKAIGIFSRYLPIPQ